MAVKQAPVPILSYGRDGELIESERQRLAREIHDGLIQELTGAVLQLEICEKIYKKDPSEILDPLIRAKEQARKCLRQLRQLTFDLRLTAVKELGLVEALRRHCDELSQENGIPIEFKATKVQMELPLPIARSLFCIAREALLNATKHAQARRIEVDVRFAKQYVMLAVKDDGTGFNVESTLAKAEEQKSFGIVGMRERAHLLGGSLEVQSKRQSGTEVIAVIPYPPLQEHG
ncbi:MAG: sensor histidine kinase [Anaerolineae bacterium]